MYDVCVVGLGKLGLPLAVYYAKNGANVIGIDLAPHYTEQINQGKCPIANEANLEEFLKETVHANRFRATDSYAEAIPNSKVVIVVVPLFVDSLGNPDFSMIDEATRLIGENLRPETLVIFETTLPIGTTKERLSALLSDSSGLRIDEGFFLAFSPERVLTGRVFEDLEKYPKIVGGVGDKGGERAAAFYHEFIRFRFRSDLSRPNGVWLVNDSSTAEFVKLAETTYRDVNIALANTFSSHALERGIDIEEVISACNSQTYSQIHQPGVSVGGHCIPVYPHLYLSSHREAHLVRIAREKNSKVPEEYVSRLQKVTNLRNKKVLIYGLAYRPNVKESYLSGSFELVKSLTTRKANVYLYDPLYTKEEVESLGFKYFDRVKVNEVQVVILHTIHDEFREFISSELWTGLEYIQLGRRIEDSEFLQYLKSRYKILN